MSECGTCGEPYSRSRCPVCGETQLLPAGPVTDDRDVRHDVGGRGVLWLILLVFAQPFAHFVALFVFEGLIPPGEPDALEFAFLIGGTFVLPVAVLTGVAIWIGGRDELMHTGIVVVFVVWYILAAYGLFQLMMAALTAG